MAKEMVSSFIKDVFLSSTKRSKTAARLQRDNATCKNPSWDTSQKSFFFSSDCFLKQKVNNFIFFKCITKYFVFSYLFLLFFQFFLSGGNKVRNTSWICNLTYLNFHFWSIVCLSKTNPKTHAALSERIICDLFPIFLLIFFQNPDKCGYLAISSC